MTKIMDDQNIDAALFKKVCDGELPLQKTFAPKSICFGCGPANLQGLRIESIVKGEEVVAQWSAEKYHEAFPGVLNGGIIGSLLDCHSNWTAAYFLMKKLEMKHPPCTVTSDFHVKLLRPTPTNGVIELKAKVLEFDQNRDGDIDRAKIEATLSVGSKVCATCVGTFVSVKPGHPAYFRW
jgi:acyl-coenzyme A thioesterase PaaI-like protein